MDDFKDYVKSFIRCRDIGAKEACEKAIVRIVGKELYGVTDEEIDGIEWE